MVSVAHYDEWQASTSVPKICKAYWHDSGSSLKPRGCELHRAIFRYLGARLEVLARSPVCSNLQLGLIGGLQERVQRYLWASCGTTLFAKRVPLSSTLYMENLNAFLLKSCLWNLHAPNSSGWSGSTHDTLTPVLVALFGCVLWVLRPHLRVSCFADLSDFISFFNRLVNDS